MSTSNLVRLANVPSLSSEDCRLLVESVADYAIFMLDAEGYVATWNLGAERINGYASHEIVGEHFSRFYPAEDLAAGKPQRELEIANRVGRIEGEGWRVRKNGTKFWARVVITALRDDCGQLRGFGNVTRDLTERRGTEERLRQAEQRVRHLLDSVIDHAIFMLDPDGFISTYNPGALRLKGYTAEEIAGKHFSAFHTAEDRVAEKPARILETVRRDGRYEEEGWRVRKDGSRFWASVVISAIRDDAERVVGFAKVTRDLTDRRRAEEALRRSEERFRLLVENVQDYAIYLLDPAGIVTTWNLGAERMKGYQAGEIIGRHFEVFFPEDARAARKPFQELVAAHARGRCEDEGWRVRKDGSLFWANAILTALRGGNGELVGFAKITRDLTTQRESEQIQLELIRAEAAREAAEAAQQQIGESEQRYRALSQRLEVVFEGVADGITVQDRLGRVVFANTAAAKICGFETAAELVDTPPAEVVARFEILDELGRPFRVDDLPARRVLAGQPAGSAVLHVRERATGRDWWVLLRASAVPDADGNPELAINIWHDVTAERRQELETKCLAEATVALGSSLVPDEALAKLAAVLVPGLGDWCSIYLREEDRLRHVATAHADPAKREAAEEYRSRYPADLAHAAGVRSVISTGRSRVLNDIREEMLALSTSDPSALAALESLGMKAALLVPIRARARIVGVLAVVWAHSSRRYDTAHVALLEELGRRAGAALENAQLYASASEAARAAEEASRAKDEFLATVSHELRTPLNAIVGWSSLLTNRVTDPTVAKPLNVIYRNAQAQVRIIDDILDVSRVITGKLRLDPRPADLVSIARDAIEVIRPSATAKHLNIELDSDSGFCLLVVDPDRLQQVIWNLLSNAVKFTPADGAIGVIVRQVGSDVTVSVTDTGCGIDAAFLPHVFERFKQADSGTTRRVGGLGLGLALVRHIVELHGGNVRAESEGAGKGATFTIKLPIRAVIPPLQNRPSPPEASASPVSSTTDLNGIRVLIVDDEQDARELIATVLKEAGAVVEAAGSAAEGFDAFKRLLPDVVVSDIAMPDEDGFAFIRRIRALSMAEGGRVPSLALTAFAREEDRTRAIAAGYTTHIGKPVDPHALASAVANLASVVRSA